jgi:hypothetical protein
MSGNSPKTLTREEENFFFQEGRVKISKLRFVVGNKTFAMSGITSVELERIFPALLVPVGLFICGAIFCYVGCAHGGSPMYGVALFMTKVGLLFFGLGGIILALRCHKYKYSVKLNTSGGEVRSFISRDKRLIARIVDALNEGIIQRG